ncbi:MAG: methyltransferase domain-containing protein, partial [Rudaea sp.]|nr:methyltransferase domain-containing protein [Rudaea sp.]
YARALEKQWFYPLTLPDGRQLTSTHDGRVDAIHHTRARMLDAFLADKLGGDRSGMSVIDLACHQGWFSLQLARAGFGRVEAIDARAEHVEDAALLAQIYELSAINTRQRDVFALKPENDGMHDLVLLLGRLCHLENAIGALRVARPLARRACVIETQVVPHMSGMVDWGSYEYVRPLKGCFGIIDEVDEIHAPEASVTGVCLAPSTEGLIWLLRAIGFRDAYVLPVPADGYEQLRHGKRVMVAALV